MSKLAFVFESLRYVLYGLEMSNSFCNALLIC